MTPVPWWQQPFFQIGIPLILTQITTIVVLIFGFLNQNKRLDDIIVRLGRIEENTRDHDRDIAALKERTGFVKIK